MGIDQANEQNNRAVKVDSGAIGIRDNENALSEWALSEPYVAKMVWVYKCLSLKPSW